MQPPMTPSYPTAPERSDQFQTVLSQMEILAQEMVIRKGEITTLHTGFLSMAQQQEWVTGRLVELENLPAKVEQLDLKWGRQAPQAQ